VKDAVVRDVVTTVPATFTLKLGIPIRQLHPYLLGGAGLQFTHIERKPGHS
jgi:hypothetical protein